MGCFWRFHTLHINVRVWQLIASIHLVNRPSPKHLKMMQFRQYFKVKCLKTIIRECATTSTKKSTVSYTSTIRLPKFEIPARLNEKARTDVTRKLNEVRPLMFTAATFRFSAACDYFYLIIFNWFAIDKFRGPVQMAAWKFIRTGICVTWWATIRKRGSSYGPCR